MAVAQHQPDLRLAPTLGPWFAATGLPLRSCIQDVSKKGFTAIQLDATLPDLRPRVLDAQARRDLAAYLGRCSLTPAGIDLFIPRRHFLNRQYQDRAFAAVVAAVTLAADIGRVPLSVALPVADLAEDVRTSIVQAADAHGMPLVVHAEDQLDALLAWVQAVDLPCLKLGLNPATVLALGHDPATLAQRHSRELGVGRLADWRQRTGRGDGHHCAVGEGELDLTTYCLSLALPTSRVGPVVLDLRDLADAPTAAGLAAKAWQRAAPALP